MKISVIVAVYRGKKYLLQQLDSLAAQSRKPDEVLIFDDCSGDGTAEWINTYIKKRDLVTWKLRVNPQNVGWKANFLSGFGQAAGELIFPCDQDDIWNTDKLEKMEKVMEENSNIMLLASNYIPLYEAGASKLSDRVIRKMKFDESIEAWPFNEKFLFVARPGCSFCFKRELLTVASEIGFEDYAHDALVWRAALLADGLYVYNYATMRYRRHKENVTGIKKVTLEEKREEMKRFRKAIQGMERGLEGPAIKNKDAKKQLMTRCREYILLKQSLYYSGSLFTWLHIVLKYKKFYVSLRAAAGDLYLLMSRLPKT